MTKALKSILIALCCLLIATSAFSASTEAIKIFDGVSIPAQGSTDWSRVIDVSKYSSTHVYGLALANDTAQGTGEVTGTYQYCFDTGAASRGGAEGTGSYCFEPSSSPGIANTYGLFGSASNLGFSAGEGNNFSLQGAITDDIEASGVGPYTPTMTTMITESVSPTARMRWKLFNAGSSVVGDLIGIFTENAQ